MTAFVDESGLHVKGGDGGAGAVSFRREAHVSKGGPDGGDGGSGGDVWLVADHNVPSLLSFRDHPHRRAENGTHGTSKRAHGKGGEDIVVAVPEGTIVKDRDGTVLADLISTGDRFLAAAGGQGGKGNARFLSNRRRAPGWAEQGEPGEERWLRLELKLMADVALVGLPNAGKSTLIAAISAARPKIADYPFTTLVPNLGVVRYGDTELVVADIPGLIEGASEGRGLGLQFLRHIERARVLVILIDLGSAERIPPREQERILLHELAEHQPELAERPRIVVGSKGDLLASGAELAVEGWDGPVISAATGEGVRPLVGQMAELVRTSREEQPVRDAFVVLRPGAEGFQVQREGGGFVVVGRQAERAVAVSDLTNVEAMQFVQERLKRLGVDRALARAGAKEGDQVRIGGMTFEYED
jgi:GTP-binding protein